MTNGHVNWFDPGMLASEVIISHSDWAIPMKCELHSDLPRKMLLSSLFLCSCFGASSCANSCYVGVWNGSGAAIGVSNSFCSLAKANGAITVRLSNIPTSASDCSSFPCPPQAIQHIFVALRGVQAHVNVDAAEAASGWQDLAPDLAAHPVQLDLLALSEERSRSGLLAGAMPSTVVPADEYRQIRFRFLPAEPSPTDPLPEGNACGNAGWNCIILKDGSLWALVFGAGESEIRFVPIRNGQSLFRVLPDGLTSLSLQFDSASLVALRSGETVRLVSVFQASPDFRFPAHDPTKNLVHEYPQQMSGFDP